MWLLDRDFYNEVSTTSVLDSDSIIALSSQFSSQAQDIMSVSGGVATINISGVLSPRPSIQAMLFGSPITIYSDIIAAVHDAEEDEEIEKIVFKINSPGGNTSGLFETLDVIRDSKKPTVAIISELGASAAYAIASQADEIIATRKSDRIGSVGVAISVEVSNDIVSISSTKAPKKIPDLKTPEGVEIMREELDAMHDLFVESIAAGRNVTKDFINENFGEGATVLAESALKNKMIDRIGVDVLIENKNEENIVMNLNEFITKHTDLYEHVFKMGADSEHDRVCAHIEMAKEGGDAAMNIALTAIAEKALMTQTLIAKYSRAITNRQELSAIALEDTVAQAALSEVSKKEIEKEEKVDIDALVLKKVNENFGVKTVEIK